MWRTYKSDTPTNIFFPALKIQKGNKIILDTDYTPAKCRYYVILERVKQEPLKFEVTHTTWDRLANSSAP